MTPTTTMTLASVTTTAPSFTWILVTGAVIAAGLFIYLLAAMLKPEWFE